MQVMTRFLDARLPVVFVSDRAAAMAEDALLVEGDGQVRPLEAHFTAAEVHAAGCSCCVGRSSAARALSALFLARARGTGALFPRVAAIVTSAAGRQAIADALANDVLASQWFKLA